METTYRRNLHKSYMCITEQEGLSREYERKILESQRVPHLLKMQTMIVEGQENYLYEISGKQQMEDYLSGRKMDCDMIRRFLFAVEVLCGSMSEYLLREGGICLEPEYIYVNLEDDEMYFTYLPFWEKSLSESFGACMEWILRKIDHKDQAAAELGYQIYQMCGRKNINIKKMLENTRQRTGWEDSSGKADRKEEYHQAEENWKENEMPKEERGADCRRKKEESEFSERKNRPKGAEEWQSRKYGVKSVKEWQVRKNGQKSVEEQQNKKYIWEEMFQKVREWAANKLVSLPAAGFFRQEKEEKKPIWMEWLKNSIWKETVKKEWKEKRSQGERFKAMRQKNEAQKEESSAAVSCIEEKREEGEMFIRPTEILSGGQQRTLGKLTYQGIHGCGDIWITKETFLLGKSRQQAEGIIDAEGVSRLHARISKEGEVYYLEDLNSTNGTYLNEIPLQYRQKKELCRSDRIRFGAEEYLFS
ncbi:MAG: FHA domain-containing protein [Lachnospiraceae bacterium]|nr:FHA domain-containing protein [Lachnospiraceae bacterium]